MVISYSFGLHSLPAGIKVSFPTNWNEPHQKDAEFLKFWRFLNLFSIEHVGKFILNGGCHVRL